MGLILLFTVIVAALVWLDIWPLLRGPTAWRWALAPLPAGADLFWLAAATVLLIVGWWWLGRWLAKRPTRPRAHIALLGLLGLGLLLQFAQLRLFSDSPLALQYERLASDQASGYFSAAQEIDHLPSALRHYPDLMPAFRADPHPRSKPPGIVLIYWLLERLLVRLPSVSEPLGTWARGVRCENLWLAGLPNAALAANALLGLLIPLAAALVIWPGYGLARRWGGAGAGWLAAGLLLLIPGRLLFTPQMDTVYPLLVLLSLYFLDGGWRRQRLALSFAAGVCLALGTFLSLVNGFAGLVAGLYLLALAWRRPVSAWLQQPRLWRHLAALGAGSATIWLLYWIFFQVTPLAIYDAAAPARHDLTRSYWLWLPGNMYDFALFVGLPLFVLALPRRRQLAPLSLAFWVVFAGLLLSGTIRGEVGRIWLFLAPLPVVLAALAAARHRRRQQLGLLLVMALLTSVLGARLAVTELEWPLVGDRQLVLAAPPADTILDAALGDEVRLAGFDLLVDGVQLYWQARGSPQTAYTVFVHVLDETGAIAAQHDGMPQGGSLPTTCWQPGEYVTDFHPLPWSDLPQGDYDVVVGLYDQASGQRLGEPVPLTALSID